MWSASSAPRSTLPLTADFFSWIAAQTGDESALDRIAEAADQNSLTDADWYALIGMTPKAAADLYAGAAESGAPQADIIPAAEGEPRLPEDEVDPQILDIRDEIRPLED